MVITNSILKISTSSFFCPPVDKNVLIIILFYFFVKIIVYNILLKLERVKNTSVKNWLLSEQKHKGQIHKYEDYFIFFIDYFLNIT